MTDDMKDRGAQDRAGVSLEQEHEVRYWTHRFGVARWRLEEAVKTAGHSAIAVEEYLRGTKVR